MLTDTDRAILAFEAEWIDRPTGHRDLAIRHQFGCSATRFFQRLDRLLESHDAMAADPQLVYRLRARRERRMGERSARLLVGSE